MAPPLLHVPAAEITAIEPVTETAIVQGKVVTVVRASVHGAPAKRDRPLPWGTALLIVYSAGSLLLLLRLGVSMRRVRGIAQRSRFWETSERRAFVHEVWLESEASVRPRVRVSSEITVPVAVNCDRESLILLPEDCANWDEEKLRLVLEHELCHVRRNDPGISWWACVASALLWFHPVVWFVRRRLAALAEQRADEFVMERARAAHRYADVLLDFAWQNDHAAHASAGAGECATAREPAGTTD